LITRKNDKQLGENEENYHGILSAHEGNYNKEKVKRKFMNGEGYGEAKRSREKIT